MGDDSGALSLGYGLTLRTPVWTMAPMVTQSDAPFRLLVRRHGARLVYSEMLMAEDFANEPHYRTTGLGLVDGRVPEDDHPLTVQFAANDPETLLRAALAAQALPSPLRPIAYSHRIFSRLMLAVVLSALWRRCCGHQSRMSPKPRPRATLWQLPHRSRGLGVVL